MRVRAEVQETFSSSPWRETWIHVFRQGRGRWLKKVPNCTASLEGDELVSCPSMISGGRCRRRAGCSVLRDAISFPCVIEKNSVAIEAGRGTESSRC